MLARANLPTTKCWWFSWEIQVYPHCLVFGVSHLLDQNLMLDLPQVTGIRIRKPWRLDTNVKSAISGFRQRMHTQSTCLYTRARLNAFIAKQHSPQSLIWTSTWENITVNIMNNSQEILATYFNLLWKRIKFFHVTFLLFFSQELVGSRTRLASSVQSVSKCSPTEMPTPTTCHPTREKPHVHTVESSSQAHQTWTSTSGKTNVNSLIRTCIFEVN